MSNTVENFPEFGHVGIVIIHAELLHIIYDLQALAKPFVPTFIHCCHITGHQRQIRVHLRGEHHSFCLYGLVAHIKIFAC